MKLQLNGRVSGTGTEYICTNGQLAPILFARFHSSESTWADE